MFITATEFKMNIGKYLSLSSIEDIVITKNGKQVAKLVSTDEGRVETAHSLFGIIPNNISLEEARKERVQRL